MKGQRTVPESEEMQSAVPKFRPTSMMPTKVPRPYSEEVSGRGGLLENAAAAALAARLRETSYFVSSLTRSGYCDSNVSGSPPFRKRKSQRSAPSAMVPVRRRPVPWAVLILSSSAHM
jgi:hypothetical protein